MSRLRFLLVLFLSVALDVSVPVPSQALEVVEEFQETGPARRGRRPVQHVRDTTAPGATRTTALSERRPPAPRPAASARPVAIGARVQKMPPRAALPASAPEDH
jgi:hypothetical protein